MAKVLNPLNGTEARGRIGGLVYNTWRGINYVKTQTAPAQPRSSRVLLIRAWSTYLVRLWATLTANERKSWNDYAQSHTETDGMGLTKRLTGLNWFVRCNIRLMDIGVTPVHTAPAVAAPDPIVSYQALDGVLSSQQIWELGPGTDLLVDIFKVGPHSVGSFAKIERCKHDSYTAYEVNDLTISNLFVGRYTFFARILSETNGLVSAWKSDTADVTAA